MSRCTERSGLETDMDMLEALERLLSRVVVIFKRFSGGLQHEMFIFRVILRYGDWKVGYTITGKGAVAAYMGEKRRKGGKTAVKGGNPPFCVREWEGWAVAGHSYAFVRLCTR